MPQMVQHLLSKDKALSSSPSIAKKKKKSTRQDKIDTQEQCAKQKVILSLKRPGTITWEE
jgi:hypothetical protein